MNNHQQGRDGRLGRKANPPYYLRRITQVASKPNVRFHSSTVKYQNGRMREKVARILCGGQDFLQYTSSWLASCVADNYRLAPHKSNRVHRLDPDPPPGKGTRPVHSVVGARTWSIMQLDVQLPSSWEVGRISRRCPSTAVVRTVSIQTNFSLKPFIVPLRLTRIVPHAVTPPSALSNVLHNRPHPTVSVPVGGLHRAVEF